jgi:type VI secretion system protein ImpN
MEWMDGSLETLCRTQNLRARNVTSVISAVLAALGYVHESGFAHGDIAPANMLYSTDMPDTWKLADFGIALEHRRRYGELEIRRAGSPDFTAPEQRSGNEATPAGDIYSVGRLLGFAMGHCPGEPAFAERMSRVADLFCRSNPNERPAGARSAAAAFSDAIGPS